LTELLVIYQYHSLNHYSIVTITHLVFTTFQLYDRYNYLPLLKQHVSISLTEPIFHHLDQASKLLFKDPYLSTNHLKMPHPDYDHLSNMSFMYRLSK